MNVDKVLSGRNLQTNVYQKVKSSLLATLKELEQIKAAEDSYDTFIRHDESDGVPIKTPEEIAEREKTKINLLEKIAPDLFPDDELIDSEEKGYLDSDINSRGKWGYTALHFAASEGDDVECERLLDMGADLVIKDNSGKLAWQKAFNNGFFELAEKLKPK